MCACMHAVFRFKKATHCRITTFWNECYATLIPWNEGYATLLWNEGYALEDLAQRAGDPTLFRGISSEQDDNLVRRWGD